MNYADFELNAMVERANLAKGELFGFISMASHLLHSFCLNSSSIEALSIVCISC